MVSSSCQYNESDVGHISSTPVKQLLPETNLNSPGLNTTFSSLTTTFRDNESDADYNPADDTFSTEPDPDIDQNLTETDPKAQRKFLVFEENLLALFQVCPECCHSSSSEISQVQGSYVAIRQECSCGYQRRWESQPRMGKIPAGNILLSAAVLFSGCNPTKVFRLFEFMNFLTITLNTFFEHQRSILWPAVDIVWTLYKTAVFTALRNRGGKVVVAGDGRADSPGHSAKYGAYSLIDMQSGRVIDIHLVQSNEVKSSYHMELEGLQRAVSNLKKEGISITEIITDRHLQIQKWIRENLPETRHSFDVWHIAKDDSAVVGDVLSSKASLVVIVI
ncbi:uncharacterized protein LOC123530221 [Mercenaria mercenaria]|uniref:uncharacterized protein LOC123530221 n=1 Tax=Mercenaria mercenaria TaxID=6596 RepID=UPI00234F9D64|nr:uncharacterized protein LOC123530221 [Mercenaria mercenaria]